MSNKHDELFKRLKQYMEIEGMSRYEDDVVAALKENTKDANVDYQRDGLGSLIMTSQLADPNGPKIMLAAHMDEIGFVVNRILDNGQIQLKWVGGGLNDVYVGTKAKLISSTNQTFIGVFGHTSAHILEKEKREKRTTANDFFADFGFKDKKEAESLGIEPGDRVYGSGETIRLHNPDLVGGKAMDNRAGVTVIDQVINRLKGEKLPNFPYFVGTVQEEVGCRGAKTASSILKPDVAFAIDTGASHDTHGVVPGTPVLGKGVAINVMDMGTMMDPKLVNFLSELAKKHNIPLYKYVAQGGATDAEELQFANGGVATIGISIPQRYLHSPIGVASLSDIQAIIDLMVEFIKAFDKDALASIKYQ